MRTFWTPKRIGLLCLFLTPLFWSGNPIIGRILAETVPPISFNLSRWIVALAVLLPFTGRNIISRITVVRNHWPRLLALAVLGIVAYNSLAYLALQTTTAINVAIFNSALPIVVVCISWAVFRDSVSRLQAIGILVSLVGTLAIVARGRVDTLLTLDLVIGDIWIIVGVLGYAAYTALLRWRPPDLDGLSFLTVLILIGVAIMIPLAILEAVFYQVAAINQTSIGGVLYAGIFASACAYGCWNYGVSTIGANTGSLFIHLFPIYATLLSVVVLDEHFAWYHVAGFVLTLFGIALATRTGRVAQAKS